MIALKGNGILSHHFWGEYYATLGIEFETPWHAYLARRELSRFTGREWKSQGTVVGLFVDNAGLAAIEPILARLGADLGKLTSMARSIDMGEPWTISIPVVHPMQREFAI